MATKAEKLKELLELNGGSSDGHTIGEVLTDFVEFMGGTTDDVSVTGIIDDMKSVKFGGGGSITDFEYAEQSIESNGISASGSLPVAHSKLNVTEKDISDIDLNTDIFMVGDSTKVYEVGVTLGGMNCKGVENIALEFPAEKMPTSDALLIYEIRKDGMPNMIGPLQNTGMGMVLTLSDFENCTLVLTNAVTAFYDYTASLKFTTSPGKIYPIFLNYPDMPIYQVDNTDNYEVKVSKQVTLYDGTIWYMLSKPEFSDDYMEVYAWVKGEDVLSEQPA